METGFRISLQQQELSGQSRFANLHQPATRGPTLTKLRFCDVILQQQASKIIIVRGRIRIYACLRVGRRKLAGHPASRFAVSREKFVYLKNMPDT